MQTECLNEKCSNVVSGGDKWCSMECKKIFLLDNYSDGQCSVWFDEAKRSFRFRQKIVMQEIRDSGLTASDFLRSLGDFKNDCDKSFKGVK